MKTSELTGTALDWAVASIELTGHDDYTNVLMVTVGDDNDWTYNPSGDWMQGGPIIEREGISIEYAADPEKWCACIMADQEVYGPTALLAAMRCYVASKFGDEVEIPEELSL
jgi:hypothetical protein